MKKLIFLILFVLLFTIFSIQPALAQNITVNDIISSSGNLSFFDNLLNEIVRITSYGVGINTPNPNYTLDVDGTFGVTGNSYLKNLIIDGNLNVSGSSYLQSVIIQSDDIYTTNIISMGNRLSFYDEWAEGDEIATFRYGKLGINTTHPTQTLTVAGNFNTTGTSHLKDLSIVGDMNATGTSHFKDLIVNGSLNLTGTLNVTGVSHLDSVMIRSDDIYTTNIIPRGTELRIYDAGAENEIVTFTPAGLIGIWTPNPTETLDVSGTIKSSDLNVTGNITVGKDLTVLGTLKGASLIKASQGFNITFDEDDFAEVSITNTNNGTEASTRLSFFNNIGEAFTIGKLGSNVVGSENNVVIANLGSGDMVFSHNLNSPFSTPVTTPNSFKWVLNDLSNISEINRTTWMELDKDGILNVTKDVLVGGDLVVGGILGGGSPLDIHYNGMNFLDKSGGSQFKIFHNHKEENISNIPDAFDHTLILETANISNEFKMELCLWDTPLQAMSLCTNEGASGRATTIYRSGQIVGNEKLPNNENFTLCEGANYVDCDTDATGPDFLVGDDIEAKGSIFSNENMTTGNLSVIDNFITVDGIECRKENHTFVIDVEPGFKIYKQNFTILNCGNSAVWNESIPA